MQLTQAISYTGNIGLVLHRLLIILYMCNSHKIQQLQSSCKLKPAPPRAAFEDSAIYCFGTTWRIITHY